MPGPKRALGAETAGAAADPTTAITSKATKEMRSVLRPRRVVMRSLLAVLNTTLTHRYGPGRYLSAL